MIFTSTFAAVVGGMSALDVIEVLQSVHQASRGCGGMVHLSRNLAHRGESLRREVAEEKHPCGRNLPTRASFGKLRIMLKHRCMVIAGSADARQHGSLQWVLRVAFQFELMSFRKIEPELN